MKLVKKDSTEWKALSERSTCYRNRLDYEKIKQDLDRAEAGDFIVIERPHQHRSNLIEGLIRQGLNQNKDYNLSLSEYDEDNQVILIHPIKKADK